jgi:hypothetical protein
MLNHRVVVLTASLMIVRCDDALGDCQRTDRDDGAVRSRDRISESRLSKKSLNRYYFSISRGKNSIFLLS